MLIVKMVACLLFLVGLSMITVCWISFIIDSFKEGEPGFGFFALGMLLVSLAWLIAQFVP